ncbi:hypothetical protein Acsp03_53140 [Actinomadura sp. NBRC 104412]|uniref:PGPGW domain-containing protein n=1 Tax=Actinomadura sp. NBRC 104412 TaxID=3032203 RepID=UPI0024A0659E|nr:PGPGW domain-containing protein [Actinomadura sp. NBRC 104412]GLZ07848.1 hypothetical protein Acsp03_53140 [Actinomadura sp. NBRC 104412]
MTTTEPRPATTDTARIVPVADATAPRPSRLRLLRKAGVAIAGIALIVAGLAMMVLPGPGIVALLAGLGLLGTEFPAARRLSDRLNAYARAAWRKVRRPKAS